MSPDARLDNPVCFGQMAQIRRQCPRRTFWAPRKDAGALELAGPGRCTLGARLVASSLEAADKEGEQFVGQVGGVVERSFAGLFGRVARVRREQALEGFAQAA